MMAMKKLSLNKDFKKNAMTYLLVTVLFVVMQLLSSFGVLGSAMKGYLVPVCAYISLAVTLNLLVGVCGELSLGHAGFMGIGAFSGIIVASVLQARMDSDVLRLVLAMLVGGVVAGVFGFLIGIPVLRLRGDYLAIVTLAFGEILKNIFGNMYAGIDSDGFHFAEKQWRSHTALPRIFPGAAASAAQFSGRTHGTAAPVRPASACPGRYTGAG